MNNVFYKDEPEYPALLREIKGAPKQLYYKGDWPASSADKDNIFKNCLAVVGSRRLTSYGKMVGEQLVQEIAAAGITIVSGFMYGGDAMAHQAAIRAGGQTIAVMPCGIELIHPEYQKELYQEILENKGLIISEYKGKMQPALWTYPQRNRIVAGLSKAVLVIEAGLKSGSLITAGYGRKVFAVPGPINSSVSAGTNLLIKEGAEMVTSAEDILRFYRSGFSFSERFIPEGALRVSKKLKPSLSFRKLAPMEKQILQELEREPLAIDELSRILEIASSELGTKLSLMQIKGLISQQGNKYCVNS